MIPIKTVSVRGKRPKLRVLLNLSRLFSDSAWTQQPCVQLAFIFEGKGTGLGFRV